MAERGPVHLTPEQAEKQKEALRKIQALLPTLQDEEKPRVLALIAKLEKTLSNSEANMQKLQERMTEMEESENLKKVLKVMWKAEQCHMDTSVLRARYEYLVQQTIESEDLDKMQQQIVILTKYGKDTTALQRCIDKQQLEKMCQEADGFPTISLGLGLESSSGSDGDDEDGDDEEGGNAEGRTAEVDDAKDDQTQPVDGHCAEDPVVEVIANDNPPDFAEKGPSVAFFIRDRNGEHSFTLRPDTWGGLNLKPSIFMFKSTNPPVSQTLSDMLGDLKARIGLESSLKYETLQSMLWRCPYFQHMKCMFVSSSMYPAGQLKTDFIEEQNAFFETVLFKLEFVWECILSLCDSRPTDVNECKKMLQAKVAYIEKEKEENRLKNKERKQKKDEKNQDGKKKRKSQDHPQPPPSGKDMSDSSYVKKKHRSKKSKKKARYTLKSTSEESDSTP